MKKHTFKTLLLRRFIVVLLLLFQLGLIAYFLISSSKYSVYASSVLRAISLLVALHTISRPQDSGYKLLWVFLILLFPVFGGMFYLIFNRQQASRKLGKRIHAIHEKTRSCFLPGACEAIQQAQERPGQPTYLQEHCGYPAYPNTKTNYYSPGEEFCQALLADLSRAERYIFLEYFIISQGELWERVLSILTEKVKSGTDVRVIYDDMGCLAGIPFHYFKQLRQLGIRCVAFNPFRPVLSAMQNNRDHRKIAVIDGTIAYTGGVNLADEYINAYERFGYWKDCGIRIEGPGAWGLTMCFLQMWQLLNPNEETDYLSFLPVAEFQPCAGLVQPYSDSPMDHERISENLYLQMIYSAKKKLYINTPYLIIDDAMKNALILSAKSGVEVSIITPERGDKRIVHFTTRSFYPELMNAGIRIYEFTGGFNHSKTMSADDSTAIIGTANLDYRSLYLHFECGVFLENTDAVRQLNEDFEATLERCRRIETGDIKSGFFRNLLRDICRLLSPVL